MGILGEIAKGVAEELMPNTAKIVQEVSKQVNSGKKDKKEDERRK